MRCFCREICNNQVTVDRVSQNCEKTSCATISGFAQNDTTDVQFQDLVTYEKSFDVSTVITNISNPATWPPIRNNKFINHIMTTGPVQIYIDNYPKKNTERHFSNCHYSKKFANNETVQHRWLIYSVSKDRVYYYCCCIFDSSLVSSLISEGYNN